MMEMMESKRSRLNLGQGILGAAADLGLMFILNYNTL